MMKQQASCAPCSGFAYVIDDEEDNVCGGLIINHFIHMTSHSVSPLVASTGDLPTQNSEEPNFSAPHFPVWSTGADLQPLSRLQA